MDKYTKFILTVIAIAMIGILFKGEIISDANAGFTSRAQILRAVDNYCQAFGSDIRCEGWQ